MAEKPKQEKKPPVGKRILGGLSKFKDAVGNALGEAFANRR